MNNSIWSIDGTLTGTTTQSGTGSNGNIRSTPHSPKSKTGALPLDVVQWYPQDTKWFQELLSKTNNSIQHHSFIHLHTAK